MPLGQGTKTMTQVINDFENLLVDERLIIAENECLRFMAKNCIADYDKMIETVIRYTSDQDFYNQKVAQAQLFKESNTNDNLVKYIQKLIDRVLALIAEEEKNAGI